MNEALKNVEGAQIVDHRIEGEARAVTYDNGVTIYVNYGDEPAVMDGITIDAESYRLEGK